MLKTNEKELKKQLADFLKPSKQNDILIDYFAQRLRCN